MKDIIRIHYYESPCGEFKLILGSYQDQLCMCDWQIESRRRIIDKRILKALKTDYLIERSEVIEKAILQLDEYFNKIRTTFDIPLLFTGTDFQKTVWNKLLEIPYGTTESYMGLSKQLNNPKAIRAVAAANGANPISIFVPCHRIIGSNNTLVGYGGGLPNKKKLLELELSIHGQQLELF